MIDLENITFESLKEIRKFDLFVCAVGFEERASYLATKLKSIDFNRRVCIKLVPEPNIYQMQILKDLDFEFIHKRDLEVILSEMTNQNILVDYSVMMKSLYADMLFQFYIKGKNNKKGTIYFSYTKSVFESALSLSLHIERTQPLLLTDSKYLNNYTKKILLLGLGYERYSAIGLIENLQIDYENVLVFINKEENNSRHYKECMDVNRDFLSLLKRDQIFEVNFFNFKELSTTVESIVFSLYRKGCSIIVAPMSVKSFSLYIMILSMKYDNMIFYNVTSESNEKSYLKKPDDTRLPIVYRVSHVKVQADLVESEKSI